MFWTAQIFMYIVTHMDSVVKAPTFTLQGVILLLKLYLARTPMRRIYVVGA
jgi:hypothetical protein